MIEVLIHGRTCNIQSISSLPRQWFLYILPAVPVDIRDTDRLSALYRAWSEDNELNQIKRYVSQGTLVHRKYLLYLRLQLHYY